MAIRVELTKRSVLRGCNECSAEMMTEAGFMPLYLVSLPPGATLVRLCDRHLEELIERATAALGKAH